MQKPTETQWEDIETVGGNFVKFSEPGDGVTGVVVSWSPNTGGRTFDGDECGHIILQDADGDWMTVTLDKGALKDKVLAANPVPGNTMDIRHTEMKTAVKSGYSYKDFGVRIQRTVAPTTTPAATGVDASDLF